MALWYAVVLAICGAIVTWSWRANRRPDAVSGDWLTHHYKETGRRL